MDPTHVKRLLHSEDCKACIWHRTRGQICGTRTGQKGRSVIRDQSAARVADALRTGDTAYVKQAVRDFAKATACTYHAPYYVDNQRGREFQEFEYHMETHLLPGLQQYMSARSTPWLITPPTEPDSSPAASIPGPIMAALPAPQHESSGQSSVVSPEVSMADQGPQYPPILLPRAGVHPINYIGPTEWAGTRPASAVAASIWNANRPRSTLPVRPAPTHRRGHSSWADRTVPRAPYHRTGLGVTPSDHGVTDRRV